MAEKSSRLEEIKAIDSDSTEGLTVENNTGLQTRDEQDYSSIDDRDDVSDVDISDDEVSPEAEQIREQIVETRRGLSETIDAIQEKLSFANISEQVKDQVSEQFGSAIDTAKDALYEKVGDVVNTVNRGFKQIGQSDLGKKAQENPTALALIGAGIGALLVSMLVSGRRNSKYSYDYNKYENDDYDYDSDDDVRYSDEPRQELTSYESDESTFRSVQGKVSDAANSAYETVSGVTSSAYETVGDVAGSTYETVGAAAGKTYEGVANVAGKTYESVGNLANKTYEVVGSAAGYTYNKAGDLGGQMKVNYNYYIEENPLVVGAVALAVGAAIGYAIPLTQRENQLMGDYRDNVLEKAQATAQEAIGTVKQMATDAQKVITEEVKSKTA